VATVALMGVASFGRQTGLAHDDYARRASVNAEAAAGAHVLIDDEHDVVVRVSARLLRVGRAAHGPGREHVDALPGADIDTALAQNALGLVDMEELLGLDRSRELIDVHRGQRIVAREEGKGRIGISAGHGTELS